MSFLALYRISFYLMLFFATLTMSVDATDSKIAMLFPIGVAVASVGAFLTVDRNPRLGLSRPLANFLAIGSICLIYLEYTANEDLLLLALAHWLVYLQLIKMFLPKRIEDDWFLYLLGLMQVLVGSVMSHSDQVGLTLLVWAVLALWVLSVFALRREALRFHLIEEEPKTPDALGREPYPGLLDFAFVLSAVRVTALTLALGGVIFLAMPRRTTLARAQSSNNVPKHMTGFEEEVQLGQLGEILENDSIVMSVEMLDSKQRTIEPPAEPLWRGVTMARYVNGRWIREGRHMTTLPTNIDLQDRRVVTQKIRLEANDSPVLFALRPIIRVRVPNAGRHDLEPELNSNDGTLLRQVVRPGAFDYEVESHLDSPLYQPGERTPDLARLQKYLEIPKELKEPLRTISEPIVQGIPADEVEKRARAIETYLRESGEFGYTLRMDVVDPQLDPILDFLRNRKQGHCEYFASALTLMLRSIGIPSRMVNGFKGGDWNDIVRVMSVRQKHAHSWVESYVGGPYEARDQRANWITLDPTPGMARELSVGQVGGFRSHFRQMIDLVRYIWVFYVVGYNAERQERILYQPIRRLTEEAKRGFAMMGQALRYAAKLVHFRDAASLISVRGFFVSFVGLLLLVGLVRVIAWGLMRVRRWMRGGAEDDAAMGATEAFYRRLAQLLAEFGLERPPSETQHEFARRAAVFLTGRGARAGAVSEVPSLVVDAFYLVRFGHRDLPLERVRDLESRLDELEASLRPSEA